MPYRLKPSDKRMIQVYKNGRWWDYRRYSTITKARNALANLRKKGH